MQVCSGGDDDRYYTYFNTSGEPAVSTEFLALIKVHLKLDPTDSSDDPYLTLLTRACIQYAEKYTKRTFVIATFEHYRDFFQDLIELRRSQFQALTSFEYSKDDSFIAVDSALYYTTKEYDFSKIVLKENSGYPTDIDNIAQAIKIIFTAGMANSLHELKSDLQIALLNHIAVIYENRGDCDTASIAENIPSTSKAIYDKYRILDHHL